MSTVVETVTALVNPILDEHHFYLADLEFVKEGASWFLRVYIDKPGGITLEECVLVSEALSEKLDEQDPDPIPQAYFLEVSSPGAERPLKTAEDFEHAVGSYIHISLFKKVKGQKVFEGTLKDLTDTEFTLAMKIKGRPVEQTFTRDEVAMARLAIEF
ncbi:ribosome maturation factor RimP [Lacticaseibacillus saniviri]|uniref:Ribosome maturation factor RimP n=1 Tax=Lacticaseibacillus saniviri JCM 17471 = DSM 24301 TaxID=1293598 RepID=A0A0R2N6J1_9LACO|nr:ribosome maturation factor RimP [Lacticaseibacillus saniviri]KRO18634.1 hypothetical protein IV56_GL000914 [Lacticaseibacillus saniviri JCM 17471 = DSM 24301]MCG4281893.1 ribosome maturation factor RimP [Lacticaseibacillus saniviri]